MKRGQTWFAEIEVQVRGLKPLLIHSPAGMAREGEESGPVDKKRILSAEQEAEQGCYRDEEGVCCITGASFRACVVGASRTFKDKNNKRASARGAMSVVQVSPELVRLRDPDTWDPLLTYAVDNQRVVFNNRGKKVAIMRARPRFNRWGAIFTIEYDPLVVDAVTIQMALEAGGRRNGVGDFRGECGGPYGRFEVIGWSEKELG